jgi:hypothetical protein
MLEVTQIHGYGRNRNSGQQAHRDHVPNQPIHRRIPKYNKIPLFDRITCKLILLIGFLIWMNTLIIGRFVMKKM